MIRKVDAHQHFYDLRRHHFPKLMGEGASRSYGNMAETLGGGYTLDDFKADIAGQNVVKSVHIQCSYDPQETVWLQDQADDPASGGFPHGIVSWVDFLSAGIERVLEDQATFRNWRGVRQTVASHPNPLLDRPHKYFLEHDRWHQKIKLLTKYNAHLEIAVYSNQAPKLAKMADENPNLQFILCHTGYPADRDAEGVRLWKEGMNLLAKRPNIAVKISGFGIFQREWTTESIRVDVEHTIAAFGAPRCIFGSNFPVDRIAGSYAKIWDSLDEITKSYSADERAGLFAGNAERIYRV